MTITTIAINAVNYTAYASRAEANDYLAVDQVRGTAWGNLADTDNARGPYLVAATRRLNLLPWKGEKAGGATQENAWPRSGVTYPDGTAVPDNEVPKGVENACILLAGTILGDADAGDAGTSGSNRKRLKAGSAEIEFFRPEEGVILQDETAWKLILDFLDFSAEGGGQAAFGTCDKSEFDDDYDLSRGLP